MKKKFTYHLKTICLAGLAVFSFLGCLATSEAKKTSLVAGENSFSTPSLEAQLKARPKTEGVYTFFHNKGLVKVDKQENHFHQLFTITGRDKIEDVSVQLKKRIDKATGHSSIGSAVVSFIIRLMDYIGKVVKENPLVPHRGLFNPYGDLAFSNFSGFFKRSIPQTTHVPSAVIEQKAKSIAGMYSLIYRTHVPIPEIRPAPAGV